MRTGSEIRRCPQSRKPGTPARHVIATILPGILSLKNVQKKTCHFASPTKSASRGMVYILNFIYYIKILLIYPTYTPPKFPRSYAHIPHILYQKSSKFFDANFDEPLVKSAFSTHHTPSTQAQNLSKIFSNPLILAVFHRSLDFFLNFPPIKQNFLTIDHTSIKRHLALSYHKKDKFYIFQ